MTETHELAVMCDTFHPLKLTKLAKSLDDGKYAYSWYDQPTNPRTPTRTLRASPLISKPRVVLDWDGTVTEVDGLHMIIEEFGDREIYAATEHALERGMSLHEVIAIEMGTLTLPLEDGIAGCANTSRCVPASASSPSARAVILSSGFAELIEPVLEREGVSLEVHANRLDTRATELAADLA